MKKKVKLKMSDEKMVDENKVEEVEEEEAFVITPKGIAALAMLNTGLIYSLDDPLFDTFWDNFERDMIRLGYVHKEG